MKTPDMRPLAAAPAPKAPSTPVLDLRGLTLSVGGAPILHDVALTVATGETVALLGESGSGKSMTAAAVMGLLPQGSRIAQGARILIDGRAIDPLDDAAMRAVRGRQVAMVFQDPMSCLNPFMRIGAQLAEAIRREAPCPRAAVRARALDLLAQVDLPEPAVLDRHPHQLSGGQQQRVMIAMALAARPRLLIADEATSALDATVGSGILALLSRLQAQTGTAILFITHDLGAAATVADRVIVMQGGRIVESGATAAVLSGPVQPYTRTLVGSRAMLAGPAPAPAGAPPMPFGILRLRDVGFAYPTRGVFSRPKPALTDISLDIAAGETLGILGESGSGKSTLAQLILGFHRPAAGSLSLFGRAVERTGLDRALRRRVQMIFQNPQGALNPRRTIRRSLIEPLHLMGMAAEATTERLVAALSDVKLGPETLDRYPHQLSGGQRQRVCIARALLSRPDLLVCDEIVSALDALVQMQVLAMLKELQARRGFAMLFIGHDVEAVRWMSDRIAVMHRGRVVEHGPADRIVREPTQPYTRSLMAAAASGGHDSRPARARAPEPA